MLVNTPNPSNQIVTVIRDRLQNISYCYLKLQYDFLMILNPNCFFFVDKGNANLLMVKQLHISSKDV